MLAAVLFDLDGVLVNTFGAWFALINAAARDLGYPEIPLDRFRASFGQSTAADVKEFFPSSTPEEVERYFVTRFRGHAGHVQVEPEAAGVFAALRAAGARIGVVTNSPRPLALDILAGARLEPDVVVGGDDVASPKPAPDMVLRALDRLGAPADRAILVGDSRFDGAAARAAGVRFVGFGGIEGDATIASLREVLRLAGIPNGGRI